MVGLLMCDELERIWKERNLGRTNGLSFDHTYRIENYASKNSSIFECVFFASVIFYRAVA
jgi:hypothetical protein